MSRRPEERTLKNPEKFNTHTHTPILYISQSSLGSPETNIYAIARLKNNLGLEKRVSSIHLLHMAFHPVKPLEQPTEDIPHLGQRELLSDADPGPSVERHKQPRLGLPVEPPVGTEHGRVGELFAGGRVQIRPSLHH